MTRDERATLVCQLRDHAVSLRHVTAANTTKHSKAVLERYAVTITRAADALELDGLVLNRWKHGGTAKP